MPLFVGKDQAMKGQGIKPFIGKDCDWPIGLNTVALSNDLTTGEGRGFAETAE